MLPPQKLATCNDCRMCKPQFAQPPFSSHTKCCTYYPFLTNYSVGGLLSEGGEGAARIMSLLKRRQWVLPIGVVAPPSYQLKHTQKRPEEFGRNIDFLCPFYTTQNPAGNCTVWRHRSSECATYFCVYDEGEKGKAQWLEWGEKLHQEEMRFSQECMLQKGYDWAEVEENLKYVKYLGEKGSPYEMDALTWSHFWQHHADNPVQYFIDCWNWKNNEYRNTRPTI